ncbi:prepilin peptidase [Nocardioides marmoriginsengisoli]|uniref:prepilin peptidase n=1 Tax=Nocardioides marmoriginsengisoli TaxID=661483 RepID=UPI002482AC0B|nr:A24 family peptidase [Nocardioides marmoriginsengisoli]
MAIGSFLNVVAYRVPRGESIVSPPSACPRCGTPIRNRHNVPALGWLLLRGRCFDCHEPISPRYPLVELGTGLAFAAVAVRFADEPRLLPAYLAFTAIGIALALIDLDVRRLPDVIVLPSYPVLLALLAIDADGHALLRALYAGAALFAFYFLIAMASPGSMGFGDVKLSGVIGGVLGYLSWGALLTGAFLGFVLGALVGVLLLAVGKAGRKTAVPFGPFMLVGAWVAILGASGLGEAYLRSLGA